ncbi:hypothetical protein DPMN_019840 [Dreissena polymorpha]|uniref:Uncharacterized protein n=1 Tax=Dreissena polymorpha TaxID=45954 RepID=A0A9D4NJY9_DREPO|nr:hypothetical protein DPMN_019840 [Dreissena polymorpha]
MLRQRRTRLVMVEIGRIAIREVQYQLEVNLCRNEEIIVKDNFGWIDRIVIREVQYQFEVNRCRNEEIIVKGNFGLAWPMWPGRARIDRIVIREAQYQFEVNQCRNEEVNFQGSSANSVGGAVWIDLRPIFNGYQLMIIKLLPSTYWTIRFTYIEHIIQTNRQTDTQQDAVSTGQ